MFRRNAALAGMAGLVLSLLTGAWTSAAVAQECGPSFNPRGPDAEAYGAAEGYPTAGPALARTQRYMVGSFSHYDRLRPGPTVSTGTTPSPLQRDCRDFALQYQLDGKTYALDDYLA